MVADWGKIEHAEHFSETHPKDFKAKEVGPQEAPRSRSPVPKPEQAVTETEDKIKNSAS